MGTTAHQTTFRPPSIEVEDPSVKAVDMWRILNRVYLSIAESEEKAGIETPDREIAFDACVEAADEALSIVPCTWRGVHNFLDMMLDEFMSGDAERLSIGLGTLTVSLRMLVPIGG